MLPPTALGGTGARWSVAVADYLDDEAVNGLSAGWVFVTPAPAIHPNADLCIMG